jgi:hypothetical protein
MKRVMVCLLAAFVAAGMAVPAFAQGQDQQATAPPLVQLLQSKGILSPEEAAQLSQASSADEANAKLAELLVAKGLISQDDYNRMAVREPAASSTAGSGGHVMNAFIHLGTNSQPAPATSDPYTYGAPSEGDLIPAIAPVRVLPIDVPKQGGLIPDIKLGSGANLKLYGFFKVSAVENSASSGGAQNGVQDFPLPLLLGDTGPKGDPYFLIKARSFRIGSQFEWVPKNSDLVVTGKLETDYEGDYTAVNNRSISAARSSQLSIRLAYVRLDTHMADLPVFAEFGQDWTIAGSSTLANIYETTGLMVGYGGLYERVPQIKAGVQFHAGDLKIQPEFAIVWPISADANLTELQRTGFGDRAGSESNNPGVEGRLVFQFPLSHSWKGVVPAQIIFSGHHSTNNEIVPAAASFSIPVSSLAGNLASPGGSTGLPSGPVVGATNCESGINCSVLQAFPRGIQVSDPINMWTAEIQLPTPWVTFDAKYYNGDNLRWFFGGQLNTVYNNLHGAHAAVIATNSLGIVDGEPGVVTTFSNASATSFSGQTITFGCPFGSGAGATFNCGGPIVAATLEPIRGSGGFIEASFPLSRIFNADPEGRNAGWTFHMLYGTDRANAHDARLGNGLTRSDYDSANISYKLNKWVSFVNEITYMSTKAATEDSKKFRGLPATTAHDWRSEFGTVVTF